MAVEEGWPRHSEFVSLSLEAASELLGEAVLELVPLNGGRRNTNYRVRLASRFEPLVLRMYTADQAACRREQALLDLVKNEVPVPRVVRVQPDAEPAWSLLTFVEGERCDHALAGATPEAIDRMTCSAGRALAAIHRFGFSQAGFFDAVLRVESAGGEFAWHTWLLNVLQNERLQLALGDDLVRRLERFINDNVGYEQQMAFGGSCLSHSDYKPWNLLVRETEVVAVLDWEFAFAGSPSNDIGNFLRYSARQHPAYESGFVRGYQDAGGVLPADWKRLCRMVDLINLCDFLNRPDSTATVVQDVRPLVEATLDQYA